MGPHKENNHNISNFFFLMRLSPFRDTFSSSCYIRLSLLEYYSSRELPIVPLGQFIRIKIGCKYILQKHT